MTTYCGQPALGFTLWSTMLPPQRIENARCDGTKVTIPLPPGAVFQGARYGDTPVEGTVTDDILTLPVISSSTYSNTKTGR